MQHKIQYLTDINNNKSIGIKFSKSEIQTYLTEMYSDIGGDKAKEYNNNLLLKNQDSYILTIITKGEIENLNAEVNIINLSTAFENIFDTNVYDIVFNGVGKYTKDYSVVYYINIKSKTIDDIRNNLLLNKRNLFITIGFSHRDVYNIDRVELLEPRNNFLEELKKEYIKDLNSFDFVKYLDKYPGSELDNIEIVKLTDNWAQFRYSRNKYICISYIDGLRITNIFEDSKKMRILSYTLVNKKLKINI